MPNYRISYTCCRDSFHDEIITDDTYNVTTGGTTDAINSLLQWINSTGGSLKIINNIDVRNYAGHKIDMFA